MRLRLVILVEQGLVGPADLVEVTAQGRRAFLADLDRL
jgi:hypothetical protein